VWDSLGLVDTEHYRRLIASLQDLGVLKSEVSRQKAAQISRKKKIPARQIPRFKVIAPTEASAAHPQAVDKDMRHREGLRGRAEAYRRAGRDAIEPLVGGTEGGRVYVGNLDPGVEVEDLYQRFASFGQIDVIHVPKGRYGTKGYAIVEFSLNAAAQSAVEEASGTEFFGRKIHLRISNPMTGRRRRRSRQRTPTNEVSTSGKRETV
jgi:ATP-dependent DNA helicase RecG